MESDNSCTTILLADDPANEDSFGGAHRKLATAISELIKNEVGGKTIGLEGKWGSGKSTTINILKQSLKDDKNIDIFIFDAWAHRGDPLRRSFLERAILHLKDAKGWIDRKKWGDEIKALRKKKQDTETYTSPRITFLGIAVLVSTLLVPVGMSLVNASISDSIDSNLNVVQPLNKMFLTGITIVLAPIFLYIIGGILITTYNFVATSIFHKIVGNSSPWAILTQKYDVITKTTSFSTSDPTSVEFEEKFDSLIIDALSKNSKKFVIVLDNLDRVDVEDALSILTTLQTFLTPHAIMGTPLETGVYQRVWAIVPYDVDGIIRLWNNHNNNAKAVEIASSMIDKRFQVRFQVPPLLLSDWREFLIGQLKLAFPDHNSEEQLKDFNATYMIFRDYMLFGSEKVDDSNVGSNWTPAPRDIKNFINQIGAIHRQWSDEFPIHHIAYYVLATRTTENFPEKLRRKQLPHLKLFALGEEILGNLAAMYFNVDKKLAFQFLLQEQIEAALAQINHERIRDYEELHNKGFWATLESIRFDQYNLRVLTNAGRTLEQSRIFSNEGYSLQKSTILTSLKSSAIGITEIQEFDSDLAQGFISIARLVNSPEIIVKIISMVSSAKEEVPSENISKWVDGVLITIRHDWVRENAQLPESVNVPGNVESFITACAYLFRNAERVSWAFFQPVTPPNQIFEYFNQEVNRENGFDERRRNALRVAIEIIRDDAWKKIGKQVYTRLNTFANYQSDEVKALVVSLWDLFDSGYVTQDQINNLNSQGNMHHYLHITRSKPETDLTAVAWCAFTILSSSSPSNNPPPNGNSQEGYNFLINQLFMKPPPDFATNLARIAIDRDRIDLLFDLPQNANPLKQAFMSEILNEDPNLFTPELISISWKKISTFAGDKFDKFLSTINSDHKFTRHLIQQEFSPEDAELYSIIVRDDRFDHDTEFLAWCRKGLKSIDKDGWIKDLEQEGSLAELVIDILDDADNKINLELGVVYSDALYEHASKVIADQIQPKRLHEFWKLLPLALDQKLRGNLQSRILKLLKDSDGSIGKSFFECYSDELPIDLVSTDKEVVLHLFSPLLSKRNLRGLQWLANLFERNPGFLDHYEPKSAVDELKERIQNIAQETDLQEELKQVISQLTKIKFSESSQEQHNN